MTWEPELTTYAGEGFSMLVPMSVLETTEGVGGPPVANLYVAGWFEVEVAFTVPVMLSVSRVAVEGTPDTAQLEMELNVIGTSAGMTRVDSETRSLPSAEAVVSEFEAPSEGVVSWQAGLLTGGEYWWWVSWTVDVGEFDATTRTYLSVTFLELENTFDRMIESFLEVP